MKRTKADRERTELVEVEIVSGSDDGMRMVLDVVREGPGELVVLERSYDTVHRCSRVEALKLAAQQTEGKPKVEKQTR